MHKYLSLFLILFFAAFAVNAQQQKYYRVQIFTNDRGLQQLAAAGVTIDHGEYVKDVSFSSDFSEKELALIKRSGHKYTVLIEDMAAYYVARNAGEKFETAAASFTTACGTYPVPKNITAGSMGGFYTYTELLAVLDSMASKFPKLITAKPLVSSTLTTAEGRPLYYVKISDKPNKNENEPKVLYTALHHAREPESITQLIYYMWFLLENYRKDAFVKSLVDSTEMYFIPCVNPDGYIYNQATNPNGGGYWRKNRLMGTVLLGLTSTGTMLINGDLIISVHHPPHGVMCTGVLLHFRRRKQK